MWSAFCSDFSTPGSHVLSLICCFSLKSLPHSIFALCFLTYCSDPLKSEKAREDLGSFGHVSRLKTSVAPAWRTEPGIEPDPVAMNTVKFRPDGSTSRSAGYKPMFQRQAEFFGIAILPWSLKPFLCRECFLFWRPCWD